MMNLPETAATIYREERQFRTGKPFGLWINCAFTHGDADGVAFNFL